MRHVSIALIAVASMVASTQIGAAADMPVKAPRAVAPPSVYNWSGCYIGGNAGAAWGHLTPSTFSTPFGQGNIPFINEIIVGQDQDLNPTGFIGGIQGGCNWQTSSSFIIGIEADFDYLGLKKDAAYVSPIFPSLHTTTSLRTDWMSTLRGRVGYARNDWLLFATGGLAIARTEFEATYTDIFPAFILENSDASTKTTRVGWTAGAGVEKAFGRNWTAKIEYLYADLGKMSTSTPIFFTPTGTPNGLFLNYDARLTVQTVRVGVNYKFWVR